MRDSVRAARGSRGTRAGWRDADEDRLLPVLLGARVQRGPRRFTERHAELLADPGLRGARTWSAAALWACLEQLRTSTVTSADLVSVIDAWTDGEDALCVVYRPPLDEGRVVGLRRSRREAVEAREWRLGDITAWGYEMDAGAGTIDPVTFGWNVADFDIGEPLGFVATVLRYDRGDVGWWGSLGPELPAPPHAPTRFGDAPQRRPGLAE